MIIVYILCSIFGIFNICFIKKKWRKRYERCILRIPVCVIENIARRPRAGTVIFYKPIFETYAFGDRIIIDSAVGTQLFQLDEGQKLWIYVNPDNPQEFMYESPYKDKLIFFDKCACAFPFLFMFFVLLIS